MATKNALNIEEAALLLGLTARTVGDYCRRQRLRATKTARGEWSIRRADINTYLAKVNRAGPTPRKLSHDPWCLCSRCRGAAPSTPRRTDLVDLHLFVSKELKTRLAIACREDKTDVSTIAKDALGMWLERREEVRRNGSKA